MGAAQSKPSVNPAHDQDEKRGLEQPFSALSIAETTKPLSPAGTITARNLETWEGTAQESVPGLQLARTVFARQDPKAVLKRSAQIADTYVFNTGVGFDPEPRTHQRSSGRCWLFATTNVLRYEVMKKLKLDDFQLSQSYLFIWDKLEKANYYLEQSIVHADKPIDDRLVEHLARGPLSDGGQWDMACNLLEKYGVVPQAIYPESFSSSASGSLNSLLTTEVREHALKLRRLSAKLSAANLSSEDKASTLRSAKEELMASVWTTITTALGMPPKPDDPFVWEYYDKHGKFGSFSGTPKDFLKTFCPTATQSFSLIHDPRNAPSRLYTVSSLGNIWGMRDVLYVNTAIQRLKDAVVACVKAGRPVFFGCDVGKFSERTMGIMDPALFDYKAAFPLSLGMTKAERLQTGESSMTHAMVISAVHLDENGRPVRYKVENSLGADVGDKGWFVMTDTWFDEFVYQVVVPNSLAPKDLLDIFNGKDRVVLPPWDPMGSLA